jgi:hypothetical protein
MFSPYLILLMNVLTGCDGSMFFFSDASFLSGNSNLFAKGIDISKSIY